MLYILVPIFYLISLLIFEEGNASFSIILCFFVFLLINRCVKLCEIRSIRNHGQNYVCIVVGYEKDILMFGNRLFVSLADKDTVRKLYSIDKYYWEKKPYSIGDSLPTLYCSTMCLLKLYKQFNMDYNAVI